MSIIAGIIGSVQSGGGGGAKSATWDGIYFDPVQEGQQQTCTVSFSNWDGSTVYWSLYDSGGNAISGSQVDGGQSWGTLNPGNGYSGTLPFSFTFTADASSEGQLAYLVRIGSTNGASDYTQGGYFTLRDSSQTHTLVFDLDSANWGNGTWSDTSGNNLNATTSNMGNSTDNGYTVLFNGSSTYGVVSSLTNSVYGTITLSAWIKPTVINDRTQTIIAKELCYKLRLNTNGTLTLSTGKGYAPWEVTATVGAGTVVGGQWSHIVATVDASYTRIYVNGVMITETSGNVIGANSAMFDIGAYSSDGNSTQADFFYGSMGEVKMWNYALTGATVVNEYNDVCSRYGLNPIPQSLVFNAASHQYVGVSGSPSDWALGTNWTIEWWSKATVASGAGDIYTVMSQADANSGIDIYYQNGYLTFSNGTALITEPPVGRWTHVALVCNSGSVTVYYNGRPQSNYSATANLGDSSNPLYIGRRGNNDFQYFPGELTGIRINNTVLYSTAFTPSRLPTAPTGTKLVMNGYYPLVDQSTSGHSISNGGATKTTDFPKLPATSSGGGGVGGGGFNGHPGVTVQLTPNINGVGAPEQAYAGDTITWTITSDSSMSGTTIYWWVDNDTAPMSTWESGANSGSVVLDSNGSATFDKKVAQNINAQFRMYIGVALYFGTVTHGYIGI